MPQDRQPVIAADIHRLDGVAVGQHAGQVTQLAVHPGRHGLAAARRSGTSCAGIRPAGRGLPRRRAGFHHVLASGASDVKLVGRHGWLLALIGPPGALARCPDVIEMAAWPRASIRLLSGAARAGRPLASWYGAVTVTRVPYVRA